MKAKVKMLANRAAVDQWLAKKPDAHFSRLVTAPGDLPEPIQALLLGTLRPGECVCRMIDVPSQGIYRPKRTGSWFRRIRRMWELTPARLVVMTDRRLLLINTTDDGQDPPVKSIPAEDILYLEHGKILLFSWLGVRWFENDAPREDFIYYNSVNEGAFLPLLHLIRRSIAGCQISRPDSGSGSPSGANEWEWAKRLHDRNTLKDLPFKFMNMIPRYGLLNDERVCQVLYRPAQWRKLFGLARMMTDPRMVVLRTDTNLLIAEEDTSAAIGNYGLTLTFIPLKFVQAIHAGQDGRQMTLTIHLESRNTVRVWSLPFPPEMEGALHDFARRWNEN